MNLIANILLVLEFYLVQLCLQEASRLSSDLWDIVGNFGNFPEMLVVAGCLDRAKNNMLEATCQ